MAKKTTAPNTTEAPRNLDEHIFYGLKLNDKQKVFRDAIWSPDYDIIFCNAKAGTGKTLIAVATAMLLCKCGRYDGILYITAPVQEEKLGYLPGGIEEKTDVYSSPIYDALYKIGEIPERCIIKENAEAMKAGTALIQCLPHVYLRGMNFEKKVVIIEESQNFYVDEMLKVLTRFHDDCKVIVIGHTGQCDLYHHPQNSGFRPFLSHFEDQPRCAVCDLDENYRGWISQHADKIFEHFEEQNT